MKKFRTIILLCGIAMFAATGTANAQNSGDAGPLHWEYSPVDNSLTITGEGAMPDYEAYQLSPWHHLRDLVESVTVGTGVTSIGNHAFFSYTGITSFIIPEAVTSIGVAAFQNSGLTSITIPEAVTSIKLLSFASCYSLTSIEVASSNPNYSSENGVLFNKDKTKLIQYPIGKSETTYDIPNSVTIIEQCAFYRCSGLASITIGNSVTSIGSYAFDECSGLTSVTIPSSVIYILLKAFRYCTSLTNVINHATTPQTISTEVFQDVALSACTLKVPTASVELYRTANVWKDFGTIEGLAAGTDATLASLTVSANQMPAFNSSETDYTADFETVDIVAIPSDTAATVTGAGIKQLQTGENVFDITVTAHDGVTAKTYTVRINHGNASIQETGISNKFAVYPNPVSSSFTVDYNGTGEVAVFDISGNKMLTQSVAGKTEITVHRLPAGVYTVQLFANGKTIGSAKIIKE